MIMDVKIYSITLFTALRYSLHYFIIPFQPTKHGISLALVFILVLPPIFRFLGTSGQNIDDLKKYSEAKDTLEFMERTLRWRHLAPTAPNTLGNILYIVYCKLFYLSIIYYLLSHFSSCSYIARIKTADPFMFYLKGIDYIR